MPGRKGRNRREKEFSEKKPNGILREQQPNSNIFNDYLVYLHAILFKHVLFMVTVLYKSTINTTCVMINKYSLMSTLEFYCRQSSRRLLINPIKITTFAVCAHWVRGVSAQFPGVLATRAFLHALSIALLHSEYFLFFFKEKFQLFYLFFFVKQEYFKIDFVKVGFVSIKEYSFKNSALRFLYSLMNYPSTFATPTYFKFVSK